jgi:hypothetical protein
MSCGVLPELGEQRLEARIGAPAIDFGLPPIGLRLLAIDGSLPAIGCRMPGSRASEVPP